jgi:hypothetical protein
MLPTRLIEPRGRVCLYSNRGPSAAQAGCQTGKWVFLLLQFVPATNYDAGLSNTEVHCSLLFEDLRGTTRRMSMKDRSSWQDRPTLNGSQSSVYREPMWRHLLSVKIAGRRCNKRHIPESLVKINIKALGIIRCASFSEIKHDQIVVITRREIQCSLLNSFHANSLFSR